MDLDDGAVQRNGLQLDAHDLFSLQLLEDPVQYAVLRPTIHTGVDRMPVTEPRRQGRLAAQGCGNHCSLSGGDGGMAPWSGDVLIGHIGADIWIGSSVTAGGPVSRSRGSFDVRIGGFLGPDSAHHECARAAMVHPYLAWSVSRDLSVWATLAMVGASCS